MGASVVSGALVLWFATACGFGCTDTVLNGRCGGVVINGSVDEAVVNAFGDASVIWFATASGLGCKDPVVNGRRDPVLTGCRGGAVLLNGCVDAVDACGGTVELPILLRILGVDP